MTSILGCGPTLGVDGPPPFRPLYGLLQAAEAQVPGVRFVPADPGAPRWENGIAAHPYPAHPGAIHTPFYDGTGPNVKDDGDASEIPEFWPVTVYEADTCTANIVGPTAAFADFKDRLLIKFAVTEGPTVAHAFLTGEGAPVAAATPGDSNVDILASGAAQTLQVGLAALEGAIADAHMGGVIHMSPMAALLLSAAGHIIRPDPLNTRNQNVLRSGVGTLIVPDQGYADGATPSGGSNPTATQEWMYATGPVDIRRDEIQTIPETIREALDRGLTSGATNGQANSVTVRVERNYLVSFDNTIQAAVLVNRS